MSGLAIAFADERGLLAAMRRLRDHGIERIEAFTPYPIKALDTLPPRRTAQLAATTFLAACAGAALGLGMQWYGAVVGYPLNIGGRPLASWPAFLPIGFEMTVLGAVLGAFAGFLVLARLPRLYQPVASIPGFERATQDRFFIVIDRSDARFDAARLSTLIEDLRPCSVVSWRS